MPAAPKFDPARRNARSGPVKLPAEGRSGDPPPWPLPGRKLKAEQGLWAQLWATPQAVAWERLGWTRTVARYCRVLLAAERMDKDALAEARQLEDRLGLTPKSMRLLLWEIASDEVAERRAEPTSVRGRIKAV
ncbi:MAG TPA: hypothetical protein VIS06_05970 [Mycobacteriales bacterium]